MAALKNLGVKAAVGFSAVGSLREEVKPRDFLVAGGVVDWTKGVSGPCFALWKVNSTNGWILGSCMGGQGVGRRTIDEHLSVR